jgi:putative thioredoxin
VDVTQHTFADEVIARSQGRPVVVDFWADWCGPCHALTPVLEQAVSERGGVELVKVDVDENPELSAEYGVRGIPAVKAFRNGRVVAEFVGAQPPARVEQFLDELLAPSAFERLVAELRESGREPELLDALEAGDHERALDLLLGETREAEPERRNELRSMMVALFDELGQDDPLSVRYRKQLAAALY